MVQLDPPPDKVPTSSCVAGSQIPEPDDPGSVTPEVQVTRQWEPLPPVPMQLLPVVSGLLEKLMHSPSPLG